MSEFVQEAIIITAYGLICFFMGVWARGKK